MNDFDYLVITFVEEVCDILEIDIPFLKFNNQKMHTETMYAVCDVMNDIIYVRKTDNIPNTLFAIAHELRHLYQYKIGTLKPNTYFRSDGINILDYNAQPVEIDAHAFACAIMDSMFNLQPDLTCIGEKNYNKVKELEQKIKRDYDL